MATSLQQSAEDLARKNQVVPLTNEFDETKGAAGRVASIVDDNSKLMQQAATSGTQMAAARGLTNSSLAAQASQNAVLTAATPIASQDAQLYSQNALSNLQAKNAAATTNANNATQLGGIALSKDADTGMQDSALKNSNEQQRLSLAQQADQFKTQSAQSQQQIDNQVSQFASSLGMTTQDLQIKRDSLTQAQQQFLANLESQRGIANLNAQTSLQTANISADAQRTVATLNDASRLQIAKLETANRADIQGNANIQNAWQSTMNQISTIQNNPNLELGAKQTLIQNTIDGFQSFTTFWKKQTGGGVDVSDLLNFNTPGPTGAVQVKTLFHALSSQISQRADNEQRH